MKAPFELNTKMNKLPFYLLNLTWGLPVNLAGGAVALGMMATGHKPQKYGNCALFEVGRKGIGHSMGLFLFVGKGSNETLKAHEHGHSLQNCYYGPLMPFLIDLPSSTRFWYRQAVEKLRPDKKLPPYDSVWFEDQATVSGLKFIENLHKEQDIAAK